MDTDIKKVTILGVLLAIFFSILQYYPPEYKTEVIGIELSLIVISKIFLKFGLLFFVLYLLALGFDQIKGLNLKIRPSLFYDLGFLTLLVIIIYTIFIVLGLRIVTLLDGIIETNNLIFMFLTYFLLISIFVIFLASKWFTHVIKEESVKIKKVINSLFKKKRARKDLNPRPKG